MFFLLPFSFCGFGSPPVSVGNINRMLRNCCSEFFTFMLLFHPKFAKITDKRNLAKHPQTLLAYHLGSEGVANCVLGCGDRGLRRGRPGVPTEQERGLWGSFLKYPCMTLGTSAPFSRPLLSLVK